MPAEKTPKRKHGEEGEDGRDPKRIKQSPHSPTSSTSSTASADPGVNEKKRLETYLTIRAQDLGIPSEPGKGHDAECVGEDDPDFEYTSENEKEVTMDAVEEPIVALRKRCDDLLDTIEEGLRTVDKIWNRTLHPDIIFPNDAKRKTRNQRRRKHKKTYRLNVEVDPILQIRESKAKGKAKKKMYAALSPLALRNLANELSQQLVDELIGRRVQHPRNIAPFRYFTNRAKTADAAKNITTPFDLSRKIADEAHKRGLSLAFFKHLAERIKVLEIAAAKLVKARERTLEQQWTNHGLSLREILDLYNNQGSRCVEPIREQLEFKCRKYGLSTHGELWDLERSILLYELAGKRRLFGYSDEIKAVIDSMIFYLRSIKPERRAEADGTGDDGTGDSGDNAGGAFEDIGGTKGKGKETGTTDRKSTEEAGVDKGGKGKAAATTTTRALRGDKNKGNMHIIEEGEMATRRQLTISTGGRAQAFDQHNVSGAQLRCFWHAIQYLWLGGERERGRSNEERYPVNARVQQLWDAVMYPPSNVTNPARQTRLALYQTLQNNSLDNNHGSLEHRIRNMQMGDEDMAQLVADALDVEIFMYRPMWNNAGQVHDWYRIVRGEPQTDPARQLHLANYSEATHWTALTPIDSLVLPPLPIDNRRPTFSESPNTPRLNRLAAGAVGNQDLRPSNRRSSPEDGHVPDLSEEMITEGGEESEEEEGEEAEEEDGKDGKDGKDDKDDKDGKDDQQDGDGADGMNRDGNSDSDEVMSEGEEKGDPMEIEKPTGPDTEMKDSVAAHYAAKSHAASKSPSPSKSRPASKTKQPSRSPEAKSSTKSQARSSPPKAKSKQPALPNMSSSTKRARPKAVSILQSKQRTIPTASSKREDAQILPETSKVTAIKLTFKDKLVQRHKLMAPIQVAAAATYSPKCFDLAQRF